MNVGMGHRFVQQQGRAHEHAELGCLLVSLNTVCQGGLSLVLSLSRRSNICASRTPRIPVERCQSEYEAERSALIAAQRVRMTNKLALAARLTS